MSPNSAPLTTVSLFSGVMGLDVGMASSGRFAPVAAVEAHPDRCESIAANRDAGRLPGGMAIVDGDVSRLSVDDLLRRTGLGRGGLDVLVGGPPCQSFSTAGNRGGRDDPRGRLMWDFLRFVEGLLPRAFVIENVPGLVNSDGAAAALTTALAGLAGGIYRTDVVHVDAADHGAPQWRERIVVVGQRVGVPIVLPDATHGDPMAQSDLFGPPLLPRATLRDALRGLDRDGDEVLDFSPRKKRWLAKVPAGGNWRDLSPTDREASMGAAFHAKGGRSGWWRRLSWDRPCPTLVGSPNHSSTSLCHPDEVRALSVREYARIQGFPDDWEFRGTLAERYRQIGDAVPVALGRMVGLAVATALDAAPSAAAPGRTGGVRRLRTATLGRRRVPERV